MSRQDMAGLGNLLGPFLSLFADCFRRPAGRLLLAVYVRGLLSNVQRKNVEVTVSCLHSNCDRNTMRLWTTSPLPWP